MCSHLDKATEILKNQKNITLLNKHNTLLKTDSKVVKVHEFPDKKFKIFALKKLRELQENTVISLTKSGKQCKNKKRHSMKNQKKIIEILELRIQGLN